MRQENIGDERIEKPNILMITVPI